MRPPRSRPDATVVRAAVRQAAPVAGGLVVLAGLAVLYGWWREIGAVAPISGALLMLCGTSLVLSVRVAPPRWAIWLARVCAMSALVVAGAALIDCVAIGGRASPQIATSTLLAAASLLVLGRRANGNVSHAQLLALVAGSIPTIGLLGYAFGIPALYRVPRQPSSGMAVMTATAILILSAGILAARPDVGPMTLLTSSGAGGITARRLLLGLLGFFPVAFLIVLGQRLGLYDEAGVSALLTFFGLGEAVAVIFVTCSRLDLDDRERGRAEERLRASEAHARELFEQAAEGIMIANDDGRYTDVNGAACRMLRLPRERIVGQLVRSFIAPQELDRLRQAREALLAGRSQVSDWTMRCGDGSWIVVEVNTKILSDGRWEAFVRDITERRHNETELERLREEWSSIIAHDLRQPVAAISLTAESLLGLRNQQLSGPERRSIERIRSASQRLARMIEDLLDFSRIEAKRLSVQPRDVDFCTIIEAVVESHRETNAIRVVGATDQSVSVDPDRIHQVLDNLISNAVKYGRPEAEIRIEWFDRGEQLEVVVTNQGAGIPAEELPNLFSRFGRTRRARAHRTPGIGLGLYIARGLVEAHGGRIWAESVQGRSTSFHFTLPTAPHRGHLDLGAGEHAPA